MSEASLLAAIISWGAFQTLEKTFFDARQKMERLYLTVYLKAFTSFSRDQIADRLQTVRIQRWFIHAKQAGSFLFQHEFLSCNFTIFYCVYSSPTSYTPNNTCIWRLQRGRVRRRFRVLVRLSPALFLSDIRTIICRSIVLRFFSIKLYFVVRTASSLIYH